MEGADASSSFPGSQITHPVWKQMALYKSDDTLQVRWLHQNSITV